MKLSTSMYIDRAVHFFAGAGLVVMTQLLAQLAGVLSHVLWAQ